MNTEVIIIVVAVLVLLGVLVFVVLKKEKYATTQPPTATQSILTTISNVLKQVSILNSNIQNKLDYANDLSIALSITALYVSKNIDAINNYIAANKGSTVSPTNSLFVTSLAAMQEISLQFGGNTPLNTTLVSISNNLFIIYLNMSLNEEIISSINNTETYTSLLTLFPEFPILFKI